MSYLRASLFVILCALLLWSPTATAASRAQRATLLAQQNEFCIKAAGGLPGSFVATETGKQLSFVDSNIIPDQLTATGTQEFFACLAIEPAPENRSGVVNLRVQLFSQSKPKKTSNEVFLKNSTQRLWEPHVKIRIYQNYHECPGDRNSILANEFHESYAATRTNDPAFRRNLSFEKDVAGSCNIFGALFGFLGQLPLAGQIAGVFIGPAVAGPLGMQLDNIVKRRSILVNYSIPGSASTIHYVRRQLGTVKIGQCIRVEASEVVPNNLRQIIPGLRLPIVLGLGCLVEAL